MPYRKSYRTPARRTRRFTRRVKRRAVRSRFPSQRERQLMVYAHPFAAPATAPKIPDGKATSSLGITFQSRIDCAVAPFNVDGAALATNTMMQILMFPGVDNGIAVYGAGAGTNGDGPILMPYDSHLDLQANTISTPAGADTIVEQGSSERLARWRLVSQGLNISLVNGAELNDGWWEAIHFNGSTGANAFHLKSTGGTGGTNVVAPVKAYAVSSALSDNDSVSASKMVQSKSYSSGKLRDIHKVLFKLKAHNTDHPFQTIRDQYQIQENSANGVDGTDAGVREQASELMEACIDQSYNMCLIRIHGHQDIPTVADTATRVRLHIRSNQELMYREGTKMERAHTRNGPGVPQNVMNAVHRATETAATAMQS